MGVATIWCLPCPFSKNTAFSKKALKTNKFWKIQKNFCIPGSIFIGLFNGTLFVFIISLVGDRQKETFLRKISNGHHCTYDSHCSTTNLDLTSFWAIYIAMRCFYRVKENIITLKNPFFTRYLREFWFLNSIFTGSWKNGNETNLICKSITLSAFHFILSVVKIV